MNRNKSQKPLQYCGKPEVTRIEVSSGGIRLEGEHIDNYFIRDCMGDAYILEDVELEDIRLVSLMLEEIYEFYKKIDTTKGKK